MTANTAYLEVFGCRLETEDGHDHDGPCEWGFICGICQRWLDGVPCPVHAPVDVPGLMLADCTASSPHPRTWVLADDTGYGAPCMYCAWQAEADAHSGCAHSHHWPWRRWRATRSALYRLTVLGAVSGYWTTWDQHCRGCASSITWGRAQYLLGWPRWKWSCLLRGRHWPGVPIMTGVCGKCAPCPGCGSVVLEHGRGCPVGEL